jgi:hypothetical protein
MTQDTDTRLVPLTRGKFAIVDAEDYDRVMRHSWCAWETGGSIYPQSRIAMKIVYLHRFILNAPSGVLVDHKNHDTLDNRRCNIRLASRKDNQRNQLLSRRNTSGFKGVSFAKLRAKPWRATVSVDNKSKTLGWFAKAEEAAHCYDEFVKVCFGEFALLNFPQEGHNVAI